MQHASRRTFGKTGNTGKKVGDGAGVAVKTPGRNFPVFPVIAVSMRFHTQAIEYIEIFHFLIPIAITVLNEKTRVRHPYGCRSYSLFFAGSAPDAVFFLQASQGGLQALFLGEPAMQCLVNDRVQMPFTWPLSDDPIQHHGRIALHRVSAQNRECSARVRYQQSHSLHAMATLSASISRASAPPCTRAKMPAMRAAWPASLAAQSIMGTRSPPSPMRFSMA